MCCSANKLACDRGYQQGTGMNDYRLGSSNQLSSMARPQESGEMLAGALAGLDVSGSDDRYGKTFYDTFITLPVSSWDLAARYLHLQLVLQLGVWGRPCMWRRCFWIKEKSQELCKPLSRDRPAYWWWHSAWSPGSHTLYRWCHTRAKRWGAESWLTGWLLSHIQTGLLYNNVVEHIHRQEALVEVKAVKVLVYLQLDLRSKLWFCRCRRILHDEMPDKTSMKRSNAPWIVRNMQANMSPPVPATPCRAK